MSADWAAIQTDYAAGASYRTLAARYGINKDTIMRRAQKEKWADARKTYSDNLRTLSVQKTAEAISNAHVNRISRLMLGADKATEKLIARLDKMDEEEKIKTYEIKAITEAFKNIRDLYESDTAPDSEDDGDGLKEALSAVACEVCSGEDDSYLLPGGGCDGEEESR